MKALMKSFAKPGLWLEDTENPSISSQDVLIKIKKTAICGTDIKIYNWEELAKKHVNIPQIIGHEFYGEIVEIGKEVKPFFKVGDRVSGEGHIACGHCRNCRAGRSHLCRINVSVGVTRHGCFAEYLSIPATNVYPIPDFVTDAQAAVLDPLGNATHTALSFDLVGEDVLITGAGPVGLMAASIAKHLGARHVVITDVNTYRLNLAKKMGVTLAVDLRQTSLNEVMSQLKMKEGFDVGLEMSGNAQAFNDMVAHMNHAGKIAMLGFIPNGTGIDWHQVIFKGLILKGIYGREMYDTWYKMINMLECGLDISTVITHEYCHSEFEKAFAAIKSGESGKVIMNWD